MPDMVTRTLNILESARTITGNIVYEQVTKKVGTFDEKSSPDKVSEYVKIFIDELEKTCGSDILTRVIQPCGHRCISNGIIARARALYKKSKNIDDFLLLMNEHHIGGGKLHMVNGKITGIYKKCYCGIATKSKGLSPLYCYCSVGWYEHLFSSVLDRRVDVQKLHTILDGSNKCVFEITIQEGSK